MKRTCEYLFFFTVLLVFPVLSGCSSQYSKERDSVTVIIHNTTYYDYDLSYNYDGYDKELKGLAYSELSNSSCTVDLGKIDEYEKKKVDIYVKWIRHNSDDNDSLKVIVRGEHIDYVNKYFHFSLKTGDSKPEFTIYKDKKHEIYVEKGPPR